MSDTQMRIALISDVFFDDDSNRRLINRLREAKQRGADLAVLPELPLNPWSPATKEAVDEDAEPPPPDGTRFRRMSAAARTVGIGLIGGAIVRDTGGRRFNTAQAISASGELVATYAKTHLPVEEGFWESSHYEPGIEPPRPIDHWPVKLGIQICSDVNRPEGTHLLAAQGTDVVVAPRATEQATYERWRPVFIANAITTGSYFLSVNRPAPERGVLIGGPSIAVGPRGEVLAETTDPVVVVDTDRKAVLDARGRYPGYLAIRSDMYASAWAEIEPRAPYAMGKPA